MAKTTVPTRILDLKRVNYLYRYEAPYGSDICTYCGDNATTDDHVAPISYVCAIIDTIDIRKHKISSGLIIVPSCNDCNIRAGSSIAHSINEKRLLIHRRLRAKFRTLLGSYDWQDDELCELGYSLQTYIISQENKRDWLLRRLGWPKNRFNR